MLLMFGVVVAGLALGAAIAAKTAPLPAVAQAGAFQQNGGSQGQLGNRNGQGNGGNAAGQAGQNGQGPGQRAVIGSVSSLSGDTLTVKTQQGDTKVNVSGAKIQKTVAGTTDDLKAGETVVAMGQQGSDGGFTATSIQIRPQDGSDTQPMAQARVGRQGGQGQGQAQAQGQTQGQAQTQGQGQRPLSGKVSSVSGDTLTLTTQQGDTKIKIAGAQIQKTVDGTTDDLKAGETVVVTGEQASDGTVSANTISVRPANAGQDQPSR